MMKRKRFLVLASALVSMAAVSWAADAEVAGDYTGTMKSKFYSVSGKTSVKSQITLSLANGTDESTFTINGVQTEGEAVFTGASGLIAFLPDVTTNSLCLGGADYKNGRIKSTVVGLIYGPPLQTIEGKISLKRTTP
jgi:hypothetical protein